VIQLTPAETALLHAAKARMLEVRSRRVRPHLDDKILASWNGLMLGALARAGIVLDEPAWIASAEKNLAFLRSRLWTAPTSTEPENPSSLAGRRTRRASFSTTTRSADGVLHLYEATLARLPRFRNSIADAARPVPGLTRRFLKRHREISSFA
jgi:hypothetical protein